jgi:2Fe-2S ferredoxin
MSSIRIYVHLPDGAAHSLEAPEGWRVMEVIRDWGLPIKAECGGAGACATCHVRVADDWLGKLPEPSAEEIGKLDEVLDVDDRSRLACQILTAAELDGLEVELVSDSLVSQTYWAAG